MHNHFHATITRDKNSHWTCVVWPESSTFFGTRRPVKVLAAIDGYEFRATFLPIGEGIHMVPVRAAVLKAIGKRLGDVVEVHLKERL